MSIQITDTENIVYKSRFITRNKLCNESTRIDNPSETDINRENLSVSVFLDIQKFYQVQHQILFVLLARIK